MNAPAQWIARSASSCGTSGAPRAFPVRVASGAADCVKAIEEVFEEIRNVREVPRDDARVLEPA